MTKEQWQAILDRNHDYDGKFWYGSNKAETFCRPSCASRHPNPENIIIFDHLQDALNSGRRPCRRCHPDSLNWQGTKKELANAASRLIEQQYTEKFSLERLASQLFVDKSYLLRTYKEITGNTLLWYHNYIRCEHAKALISQLELNMTEVAYRTGFNSSTHFSRVFQQITGKSPSAYRKTCIQAFSDMQPSSAKS